jgi:hypothetical protein
MGEHGFIGFGLFVLLGALAWIRAQQIIKRCKKDPEKKWASDLAAMIQVSLIGYAAGGAFLGMGYFDLPYHLMIILVLTAKFSGVMETVQVGPSKNVARPPAHPSARWDTPDWPRR